MRTEQPAVSSDDDAERGGCRGRVRTEAGSRAPLGQSSRGAWNRCIPIQLPGTWILLSGRSRIEGCAGIKTVRTNNSGLRNTITSFLSFSLTGIDFVFVTTEAVLSRVSVKRLKTFAWQHFESRKVSRTWRRCSHSGGHRTSMPTQTTDSGRIRRLFQAKAKDSLIQGGKQDSW